MEFGHLGIEHNEITRDQAESLVEIYRRDVLGLHTALKAARRFSNGRVCTEGQGTGLGDRRRTEIVGTFNVCYWVQVEGVVGQWVVRFPKKCITSEAMTSLRLRSEVATLNFLHDYTRVPVPRVIGYGDGQDGFPPFLIMKIMDGIRLTLVWNAKTSPRLVDSILRDIAAIHLELLSHPFDRIGMLDLLPPEVMPSDPPTPKHGPFSLDAMDTALDGVSVTAPSAYHYASDYYNYKISLWNEILEKQPNSVDGIVDGRRKLLNEAILREFIKQLPAPTNENGPFYITHCDLHASNIIVSAKTLKMIGVIDWEGACALPLVSACAPPRCIFLDRKIDLIPKSQEYRNFEERTKRYVTILSELEGKTLKSSDTRATPFISAQIMSSLANKSLFLSWALDDLRQLDHMVWCHLVPQIYPDLEVKYDALTEEAKVDDREIMGDSIDTIIDEFVESHKSYDAQKWNSWLEKRLCALNMYDKSRKKRSDYNGSQFPS